jgi:hypothetical protein
MDNLENEVAKLRFQIKLISETIDRDENPILHLAVFLNWSEEDLEAAHNIFEEYSQKPDLIGFERQLKERFDIDYQQVKRIILAFYRTGQHEDVCERYAKDHPVTEFHEILHPHDVG